MEKTCCIYLAGNIRKGAEDKREQAWDAQEKNDLRKALGSLKAVFLDPSQRSDDLSDQESVFGRDLLQVFSSDVVLVDARGKRGLGVGAEMMFAKLQGIPVVAWLPSESHYKRAQLNEFLGQNVSDWVHPFIFNLCDYTAETLEQAAAWIIQSENTERRDPYEAENDLLNAMEYYYANQLSNDKEMQAIGRENPELKERWDLLFSEYRRIPVVSQGGCGSGCCH